MCSIASCHRVTGGGLLQHPWYIDSLELIECLHFLLLQKKVVGFCRFVSGNAFARDFVWLDELRRLRNNARLREQISDGPQLFQAVRRTAYMHATPSATGVN